MVRVGYFFHYRGAHIMVGVGNPGNIGDSRAEALESFMNGRRSGPEVLVLNGSFFLAWLELMA